MVIEWQWDQLRIMKVGGNESATKYFQSHGGSALLANKDAKARYTSSVASKYKDELKRRAAADSRDYPEEVVITDLLSPMFPDGTSTPSGEPADDFFSSWDKPTIKRPSNPPSRSTTPATRTASPFLKPAGAGIDRSKTPPGEASSSADTTTAAAASRTTTSSALRKTTTTSGPRKANILGAKKTQKLGVKKAPAGEVIDFDEAEKKAKEEAERIAKLGYDPDAEDAPTREASAATPIDKPSIASPSPISPPKTGTVAKGGHQRTASELERLGMGIGRLGFGQVGSGAGGSSKPAPKKLGFGSVGTSKPTEDEGMFLFVCLFVCLFI
jgi:ADP-ribosylation factor GTPase-activating protein 2/3